MNRTMYPNTTPMSATIVVTFSSYCWDTKRSPNELVRPNWGRGIALCAPKVGPERNPDGQRSRSIVRQPRCIFSRVPTNRRSINHRQSVTAKGVLQKRCGVQPCHESDDVGRAAFRGAQFFAFLSFFRAMFPSTQCQNRWLTLQRQLSISPGVPLWSCIWEDRCG